MSLTVAIVLGVLGLAFYGVVFWAIGWQMGRNAMEVSDEVVNRDATPPNEGASMSASELASRIKNGEKWIPAGRFPSVAEHIERNHIKRTVLR